MSTKLDADVSLALTNRVQQVALRLIDSPPLLLREIDEQAVIDLAFSIKKCGMLQPIQLRPKKDGRYEVVFGNHRHRAAKRLELAMVPAVVKDLNEHDALLLALAENIQRLELNPVKEGEVFTRLLNGNSDMSSILALAKEIGKCADYIKTRLGIYQNLTPLLADQIGKSLTISNAAMLCKHSKEQQEEIYYRMQKVKARLGRQKSREALFVSERIDANGAVVNAYCVCPSCGTKHVKGIRGMA